MPRRSPFVESDLREREKFGFGPFEGARPLGKFEIYDEALRTLAVNDDLRSRCAEELDCILRLYGLEKLVERQETPGRQAQALQKERRWRKQRERRRKRLEKHIEQNDDKAARRAWVELQRTPRLAPALEQQLWREGRSPDAILAELSREPSIPGRIKSYALMHAVRGLQGLASRYRKDLAWARGKRPPRQLVKFIREALDVAGVKCPDEHNQDRLVALMVEPRQPSPAPAPSPPCLDRSSKLSRLLRPRRKIVPFLRGF